MKTQTIKIFVFVAIMLAGLYCLDIHPPYYYGNTVYADKMRYLQARPAMYNTLFMGASQIHRQVSPAVFDSTTGHRTRSFNLGSPGTTNPEAFYLLENFLRDPLPSVRYIFLDLNPPQEFSLDQLHTVKYKYYLQQRWYHLYDQTAPQQVSFIQKMSAKAANAAHYLEANFKIGLLPKMLYSKVLGGEPVTQQETENEGFYSIETGLTQADGYMLQYRAEQFLRDTAYLGLQWQAYNDNFSDPHGPANAANLYLEEINRLIQLAETKGIHLYFVLCPKMQINNYRALSPIFKCIPDQHKINLASNHHYYTVANSFDKTHLNLKGAKVFSTDLARQFMGLGL